MADTNGVKQAEPMKTDATEEPKAESAKVIDKKADAAEPMKTDAVEEPKAESEKVIDKSESAEDTKPAESTEEPTKHEQRILEQIEYYFGDINLPRDRFLLQEIKEDDNGWVPFQTMTKFKRLAQLSEDIGVLATAMRKSTTGLIEVSEDCLKLRRSPSRPLPEATADARDELKHKSVYAKGFPEDTTLDELIAFFNKAGKTDQVQMRRTREKDFKGSCFVIYHTAESAKAFLTSEETAKYGETDMKRLMKDEYFKMKMDERKQLKDEATKTKQQQREQYMKKREEDQKKQEMRITHGAVLYLKNVPKDVTREDLKALFADHGTVAWAEFDKGDPTAKLRFNCENGAKSALTKIQAAMDGKVVMCDQELECSILEGEEELAYWKDMFSRRSSNRNSNRNSNRGGGGGGRHSKSNQFYGKHRKRKPADGDDEGPSEKATKTEDD